MGSAQLGLWSRADTYDKSVYHRSWIILNIIALSLSLVYIFAHPYWSSLDNLMKFLPWQGNFPCGCFLIYLLMQWIFPSRSFSSSQSKGMAMDWISAVALVLHIFLSWLCIMRLVWGLSEEAITLNLSWWIVLFGRLVYILSSSDPGAWNGLSWFAFKDLGSFF